MTSEFIDFMDFSIVHIKILHTAKFQGQDGSLSSGILLQVFIL